LADLTYPIFFPKCPICGSEETIGRKETQRCRKENKIGLATEIHIMQTVTPLTEPSRIPTLLSFDILVAFYDVCDCGLLRCVKIDKINQLVSQLPFPVGPPPGKKQK
jgi:hypothetical protein